MSVILCTNVGVSNEEVWGRKWTYIFVLTSQVVGETVNKKSSNVDLVNYNFVRCNLDAFGKKVASCPGFARKPVSSWVKTSK